MATIFKKNQINKDLTDVQIKLIRSQAVGLWTTSIFAIIISIVSAYFTWQNYCRDNEEICSININKIENDYKTTFGGVGGMGSEGIQESPTINIKYNSEIINLSKNPITIISYFVISIAEIQYLNKKDLNWKEHYNTEPYFSGQERKIRTPICLQPGEAYILPFENFITIDTSSYINIKKYLKKYIHKDFTFSIVDIIKLYYSTKKDFFGNNLEFIMRQDGSICGWNPLKSELKKDAPFYFIVKTARGNYISTKVTWYSQNSNDPPFMKILTGYEN